MTNKLAPYNDPEHMARLREWWTKTYPDDKTPQLPGVHYHTIELCQQFHEFHDIQPYTDEWVDANQFAKMLVKAKILDLGNGWWFHAPEWEPKEYEIRRAKAAQ